MSDRDVILRRIRHAVGEGSASGEAPRRAYRTTTADSLAERVTEFSQRVAEYRATVRRVPPDGLIAAIATACRDRSVHSLVVPDDLPAEWLPAGVEILRDGPGRLLSNEQLDASDCVLTGCALGVAQTGSIVLDGGAYQGRRVITLLPDYHLCVVRAEQIVGLVAEALAVLQPAESESPPPITFVSGPSATSDIELNRVEGVHGPRTLEVLVVVGAS